MARPLLPLMLLTVGSVSVLPACKADRSEARSSEAAKRALLTTPPTPKFTSAATILELAGGGRVRYLGFDLDPAPPVNLAAVLTMRHYFAVDAPFAGDYQVFVHGDVGTQRVFAADHHPAEGALPTSLWKKGDIIVDTHRVRMPDRAAGAIDVWVGLFAGKKRMTVQADPGKSDGRDRIRAGRLTVRGVKTAPTAPTVADGLPSVTIPRTSAPINADGKLDEAAWKQAPVLSFSDTMGKGRPTKFPTKLRLLYDDNNLYVSFEAVDQDVSCPYEKRDDPIYDHEAVELFVMPHLQAPNVGPYVEMQASPKGIIFDAAFVARRTGMAKSWNAGQIVGTTIDGTLNVDDGTDKGFISEWSVPWKNIRDVKAAPTPGTEWRMNAFRIEKYRVNGKVQGEYTAWSPPRVGDFHNVNRFGRMRFGK